MDLFKCLSRPGALVVLLAAIFLLGLAQAPALAAEPVTVQVKVTMSGPPATMLPVGDDDNHSLGLGRRQGEAVFGDGRKAAYSNVYIIDLFRGRHLKAWGYTKMAFPDGSWIFFKWESEFAGPDERGEPTMRGTGELRKGTGPYQGIKGKVAFTNRRLPPGDKLPRGGTLAEAVLTYTLPTK